MNYFEAALFLVCFLLFPSWAGAHDKELSLLLPVEK